MHCRLLHFGTGPQKCCWELHITRHQWTCGLLGAYLVSLLQEWNPNLSFLKVLQDLHIKYYWGLTQFHACCFQPNWPGNHLYFQETRNCSSFFTCLGDTLTIVFWSCYTPACNIASIPTNVPLVLRIMHGNFFTWNIHSVKILHFTWCFRRPCNSIVSCFRTPKVRKFLQWCWVKLTLLSHVVSQVARNTKRGSVARSE